MVSMYAPAPEVFAIASNEERVGLPESFPVEAGVAGSGEERWEPAELAGAAEHDAAFGDRGGIDEDVVDSDQAEVVVAFDGLDQVIEIAHDFWHGQLTAAQKVALVDHELCHCRVEVDDLTGDIKQLGIVGHDVEEFACVVERHGLWDAGLSKLGQAMSEQLHLAIDHITEPGDDPEPGTT